ncbi:MAG TPA: PA14 domain-containing protein [Chloroflexota bacterium]|nr:PA14 domain-containing protein [Chloroflexota bacterium]
MSRLPFGPALGAALAGLMVVISGVVDVDRYFKKQMRDASVFAEHSAAATYVGRVAAQLPSGTRLIVDERLVGEPTIRFLAPGMSTAEGYRTALLPLTRDVATVLFLGGEQQTDAAYVQRLYPTAEIEAFSPPHGGTVLVRSIRLTPDQIRGIQGLNADLTGALAAPEYGDYGFQIEAPASSELLLDGNSVAQGDKPVQVSLARGMHQLQLKTSDPAVPPRLLWRPPAAPSFAPVPRDNLFAAPALQNGLLGRYYANGSWATPVSVEQIDPFVSVYYQVPPLPLPFSVEWSGQIAAPVSGSYRFNSTSIDSSEVLIDGGPVPPETPLSLPAGLHELRIRYQAHSGHNHIELRWQPPGRDWEIVPSAFLFPSKSLVAAQPLPPLPAQTTGGVPASGAAAQPQRLVTTIWDADLGSDSAPAGVALDPEGNVYVADAGRHGLAKLDPAGHPVWFAGAPPNTAGFQQLAATAVAADGTVLVLDGESGVISKMSSSGQYLGALPAGVALYHPRGLTVAPDGDVYIVDTGGSRVVHLSADGRLAGTFGMRGRGKGGLDQPTGVTVTAEGEVLVVDPVARKIVRFASSGGVGAEWPFAAGPTVFGPQIALGRDGLAWVTDTAAGWVQAFSPDGQPSGSYAPEAGLSEPSGIALSGDSIVVAETGARRVRKLGLPA